MKWQKFGQCTMLVLITLTINSCNSQTNKSKEVGESQSENLVSNYGIEGSTNTIVKAEVDSLQVPYALLSGKPEYYYLKLRDEYINDLNTNRNYPDTSFYAKHNKALLHLEDELFKLIEKNPLSDIISNGQISLESLLNEVGFGNLDGIVIRNDSFDLLCTTEELFNYYFEEYEFNIYSELSTIDLGIIFNSLPYGAALIGICSYELINLESNLNVKVCLANESSDPHPFYKKNIYALWKDGGYVYLIRHYFNSFEFRECENLWDSIYNAQKNNLEKFERNNPNLRNRDYLEQDYHLYRISFSNYCECYTSDSINIKQIEISREIVITTLDQLNIGDL